MQNQPYQVNVGKRPMQELQKYIDKTVRVKLKSNAVFKGVLLKVDVYMNAYLTNAEEYDESGKLIASYGDVIIRGNNILYVSFGDGLLL